MAAFASWFRQLLPALCLSFGIALFVPSSGGAAPLLPAPAPLPAPLFLNGLDRHYDLSFLWFDCLAEGRLTFSRDPHFPQRYHALLEAKTLGVAAWLTGDRVQRYETTMEISSAGRLSPTEYRAMIHKKKGEVISEHAKVYTFAPATRTITMTRSNDGKKGGTEIVKMTGDLYPVDFLTAGFNFIFGVDGGLKSGERTEITTFTDAGEKKIVIEVLKKKDWPKTSFFPKGSGTLLKIILPREILDTGDGAVYALLDSKLLPQRVIVENVLGLGDVKGVLRP